jgi:hypothetical protein
MKTVVLKVTVAGLHESRDPEVLRKLIEDNLGGKSAMVNVEIENIIVQAVADMRPTASWGRAD